MDDPTSEIQADDELLNGPELLERLKIGRSTLQKYRKMGLPFIRVTDAKYLYCWRSVCEWLNQFQTQSLPSEDSSPG